MKKLNIAIVIVSDSRTLETDKSGKLLKKLIEEDGHKIIERVIVPDNIYEIRSIVSQFIVNKKIDVIISSGGTGITGSDGTPEAIYIEGAESFALAVQWHPEWKANKDPVSKCLFEAFSVQIKKNCNEKCKRVQIGLHVS